MKEKQKANQLEQIVADHEIIISEMTRQTSQLIIQTKIGWILAGAAILMSILAFYTAIQLT